MQTALYDVVIIGAGAAGLMAALELVQAGKRVVIAEARDRAGGRMHTLEEGFTLPVELGAEFIHGKLQLTRSLLEKAGTGWYEVKGDIWRKEVTGLEQEGDFIEDYSLLHKKLQQLQQDMPVADFLNTYLAEPKHEELRASLHSYVEGYYAADPKRASTFALREELEKADDEQYRVEGGYQKLVDYLVEELRNCDCRIMYSSPVSQVNWEADPIEVHTTKEILYGRKLIVTVPLGVLQAETISFIPSIPDKVAAARALGFGGVIKVLLQFEGAFWKEKEFTNNQDLSDVGFIFSEEEVPTWWTQAPKDAPVLAGWLAGPNAEKVKHLSEEDILQKALTSLANLFTLTAEHAKELLKAWKVSNWATDAYCRGGYSYEVVGGAEQRQKLKQPLEGKLFFGGEALFEGIEGGTVEAALVNGRETAHQVIGAF